MPAYQLQKKKSIAAPTIASAVALLSVLSGSLAAAQGVTPRSVDSSSVHQLDTVVITPDRSASTIRTAGVAVTAVPGSWMRALPLRSVGDALAITPGIAVIDAQSLGGN